jgi:hypothetical protein
MMLAGLNLAASGTWVTGGASLFVRGFGEDRVRPANPVAVPALKRRIRTGTHSAAGRFR